jgi:hypothetical protein
MLGLPSDVWINYCAIAKLRSREEPTEALRMKVGIQIAIARIADNKFAWSHYALTRFRDVYIIIA